MSSIRPDKTMPLKTVIVWPYFCSWNFVLESSPFHVLPHFAQFQKISSLVRHAIFCPSLYCLQFKYQPPLISSWTSILLLNSIKHGDCWSSPKSNYGPTGPKRGFDPLKRSAVTGEARQDGQRGPQSATTLPACHSGLSLQLIANIIPWSHPRSWRTPVPFQSQPLCPSIFFFSPPTLPFSLSHPHFPTHHPTSILWKPATQRHVIDAGRRHFKQLVFKRLHLKRPGAEPEQICLIRFPPLIVGARDAEVGCQWRLRLQGTIGTRHTACSRNGWRNYLMEWHWRQEDFIFLSSLFLSHPFPPSLHLYLCLTLWYSISRPYLYFLSILFNLFHFPCPIGTACSPHTPCHSSLKDF